MLSTGRRVFDFVGLDDIVESVDQDPSCFSFFPSPLPLPHFTSFSFFFFLFVFVSFVLIYVHEVSCTVQYSTDVVLI